MESNLMPIAEESAMNWGETSHGSMKTSQIIAENREVNTSLEKVTNIVNAQTLKGYRVGYYDGFVEGITVGHATGVLYGISMSLIVTGIIMLYKKNG